MNPLIGDEYQDRGMLKWGGFILAEHQQMKKNKTALDNLVYPQKPQMDSLEIAETINAAIRKSQAVNIQVEALDEQNHYYPDIEGLVCGYDELGIYINETKVHYDEIRNVEIKKFKKWSANAN